MLRARGIDCGAANPQAIHVIVKTPTRNLNSVHILTHSVPRVTTLSIAEVCHQESL